MIMLRFVAIPTAVVNILCMLLGGMANNWSVFTIGWGGAVFALYGWLFYREEAREVGQTPEGYRTLAMRLRFEITSNKYPPGMRLPSTKEYAKEFGTTRTTVARALKILAEEHVVVIVRGRGTYIPGNPTDRPRDRIEMHLKNLLAAKEPGSPMPETKWVASNLKASEMTVRRVEQSLAREGLIRRNSTGRYVKS